MKTLQYVHILYFVFWIKNQIGLEGYVVTIKKRMILAEREIGRSVVALNPSLKLHEKDKILLLFYGIKDTNQIPKQVLDRLTEK